VDPSSQLNEASSASTIEISSSALVRECYSNEFLQIMRRLGLGQHCRILGFTDEDRPQYECRFGSNYWLPTVILVAGTHGDEPASVAGLLRFLESKLVSYLNRYNFIIYPCLNPDGYVHGTRYNAALKDINRDFTADAALSESSFVNAALNDVDQAAILINLHEDNQAAVSDFGDAKDYPNGVYAYQTVVLPQHRLKLHLAKIAEGAGLSVCSADTLYGDKVTEGIIDYNSESPNQALQDLHTLDRFLVGSRTLRALTVETRTEDDFAKREKFHTDMIAHILDTLGTRG
jgi:Succinylglutamate desuccinylase / Aspartoacylase family